MHLLLQHVLPRGFRRARNYGFLHRNKKGLIALLHWALRIAPRPPADTHPDRRCFVRFAAARCRFCVGELPLHSCGDEHCFRLRRRPCRSGHRTARRGAAIGATVTLAPKSDENGHKIAGVKPSPRLETIYKAIG
ncbi:MAG: hypothetical protein ACK4KV_06610 [Rhodocyclaceae bacterium]